VRLFLAVNLGPDVRDAIADAAAPLRGAAPELKWTDRSKFHLTLKFLDEQEEHVARDVAAAIDPIAARHFAFDMRVGGEEHVVGAFPNFRRPRVVWMGVTSDPRLELLHHDVEVACQTLGFDVEGRPFRPHLALARVADRLDPAAAKKLERAAKKVELDVESRVASLDLMRSVTGPKAAYQVLHSSPLRQR